MDILKQNDELFLGKIEIDNGDTGHITNSYVLVSKQDMSAILFDPADKAEKIVKVLDEKNIKLTAIVITHAHADHISALEDICKIHEKRGVKLKVYIHQNDKDALTDDNKNYISMFGKKSLNIENIDIIQIQDGDIIKENNIEIDTIHTPGHTNGCCIFFEKTLNILVTGDTIFSDCYGRVDLESGSILDMKNSIDKIFERFDDIEIYPGHGNSALLRDIKRRIRMLLEVRR